jgi:hypothetical protein
MNSVYYLIPVVALTIWAPQLALPENLPPDDPAVLLGYFSLHHALDKAATTHPSMRHDAAVMMGISDADFTRAAAIAESVLAQLRNNSPGETPTRHDLSTSRQLEARRNGALVSGVDALRAQLPPRSWEALHRYILT